MNKKWIIGLSLLVTSTLPAQVNLSQSLTACYVLDGTATDQINNLTGTLSAVTATVDRFNNPSSALEFSGTAGNFIQLPDNPLLKPTNAFSFSAWIKSGMVASQYILMTRNPASSNFEAYCLNFENVSNQLRVCAKKGDGSGGAVIITGTNTLTLNTWYHFAFTVDNNTMNLYTNGTLVATGSTAFAFNYLSNKNIILGGSNETIFNAPFLGSMDNLRFYNRILNASEINQIYLTDPSCLNATSIASLQASEIELKIYPNPTTGKCVINTPEQINKVEIYDLLGALVLTTNNKTEIDLNGIADGVYLAKVEINKEIITRKIIKQ